MSDVFDDLAKAFKAGHDAGRSESADEIEWLREALEVIYRAHEKVLDEGDAWFITDDTTVGYYICSVLGAPPEEKE